MHKLYWHIIVYMTNFTSSLDINLSIHFLIRDLTFIVVLIVCLYIISMWFTGFSLFSQKYISYFPLHFSLQFNVPYLHKKFLAMACEVQTGDIVEQLVLWLHRDALLRKELKWQFIQIIQQVWIKIRKFYKGPPCWSNVNLLYSRVLLFFCWNSFCEKFSKH